MPELIGISVLLLLLTLFISLNMRILKENQVIIVERFGLYHKTVTEKGIHFFIPFYERPIEILTLTSIDDSFIDPKKNIKIHFTYQIIDPLLFVYSSTDTLKSIKELLIINHHPYDLYDIESLNTSCATFGVLLKKASSNNI